MWWHIRINIKPHAASMCASVRSRLSKPLHHGDEVKFFVGASETIATLRLLGTDELNAGEEGWIQLELRESACYRARRPLHSAPPIAR
jgi:hypothetical protein